MSLSWTITRRAVQSRRYFSRATQFHCLPRRETLLPTSVAAECSLSCCIISRTREPKIRIISCPPAHPSHPKTCTFTSKHAHSQMSTYAHRWRHVDHLQARIHKHRTVPHTHASTCVRTAGMRSSCRKTHDLHHHPSSVWCLADAGPCQAHGPENSSQHFHRRPAHWRQFRYR